PAGRAELVEHIEALAAGNQVVDLVEIDAAREEAEGGADLLPSLLGRSGPDLRRDEALLPAAGQRRAEHPLGLAVHRRGVEDACAGCERTIDDLAAGRFFGRPANVEGPRGAHPYDREPGPVPAEGPALHVDQPAATPSSPATDWIASQVASGNGMPSSERWERVR